MFEFLNDMFYDWTTSGFVVWIAISLGSIYVAWFVKIPSAIGKSSGMPFLVKIGMTVIIPAVTFMMIQNKEWTAQTFKKRGK